MVLEEESCAAVVEDHKYVADIVGMLVQDTFCDIVEERLHGKRIFNQITRRGL